MSLIKETDYNGVKIAKFGKYNLADNSTVMVFLLDDILIDTGPPNQRKEILQWAGEKRIGKVLLTHHHEDHSGNAWGMKERLRLPVFMHETGVPLLEKKLALRLYQKIFWGIPKPVKTDPFPEEIRSESGYRLVPIYTPGHAPDHVCFLEPDRKWLFTGDLFLASKAKLFRADEELKGEMDSLKTILEYDFHTLFCAHKGVVENGREKLQAKLDYFIGLVENVKQLDSEGKSVREIALELMGKDGLPGFVTMKHLSSDNLVRECLKIKG